MREGLLVGGIVLEIFGRFSDAGQFLFEEVGVGKHLIKGQYRLSCLLIRPSVQREEREGR